MTNVLMRDYGSSPYEGEVKLESSQIEGETIYWVDLSLNEIEREAHLTNGGISVVTYGPNPDTFVESYCTKEALGTVTSLNGKQMVCNYNQSGYYPWIQLPAGYDLIYAPRDPINAVITAQGSEKPEYTVRTYTKLYSILRTKQKQPLCSGPPNSPTWHILTYYLRCKPLTVEYTIDSLQEDNRLPDFLRHITKWHAAMVGIAPRIEEVSRDELDKLFHYSRVSGANSR